MPSTSGDPGWCSKHSCDMKEVCSHCHGEELSRFRAALETITRSHPNLVTRGAGPAPWLVAKAALLGIPLLSANAPLESTHALHDEVIAEWSKTEPAVRR